MAPNSSEQCIKLYRETLGLFAGIVSLNRKLHLFAEHLFTLRELLSKLVLWGGDFQDDGLDMLFSKSATLRNVASKFLFEINMILVRDLGPAVLNVVATSKSTSEISTLVQRVTADMLLSRKAIASFRCVNEEKGELDSWLDVDTDVLRLSEAVSQIDFYVSRLMDILPSMLSLRDFIMPTQSTALESQELDLRVASDCPMTEGVELQATVAAPTPTHIMEQATGNARLSPAPLILEHNTPPSNDLNNVANQPFTPPATRHSTPPTPTRPPLSPLAIKVNTPSTPTKPPFSPGRTKKRRRDESPMGKELKSPIHQFSSPLSYVGKDDGSSLGWGADRRNGGRRTVSDSFSRVGCKSPVFRFHSSP